MKKTILFLFLALSVGIVSADLVRGIDIEFVPIGNPGNPADTVIMVSDGTTGYGAVDYDFQIGKYEITNGQWDQFVSLAGTPSGNQYNSYDQSTFHLGSQISTTGVSWYEAAQFCNYLTSGDKSKGAYLFSGTNSNPADFLGVDRTAAITTYGTIYVTPTEDEWYKAAYYNGNGYNIFANSANYYPSDQGWNYNPDTYTPPWDVGSGAQELNGTYDMMGNVWEWAEATQDQFGNWDSLIRGGSYQSRDYNLSSSRRFPYIPTAELNDIGFRIVSIVPEPCTLLFLGFGGLLIRKQQLYFRGQER